MTNLRKAFYDMVDGAPAVEKDDRVRGKAEFFGISYDEAFRLDNEVMALCRNIARIVGDRIDRLPSHLRDAALRNFPCTVADFLAQMSEAVGVIHAGLPIQVIGWTLTPGCSCPSCVMKRQLIDEVSSAIGGGNVSST